MSELEFSCVTWRERSHEVISEVIAENPTATMLELRRLVSKAYPFGERAMHPYKVWLKAVEDTFGPSAQAVVARTKWHPELDGGLLMEDATDGTNPHN